MIEGDKMQTKEIYLAGGCFWGTEKYLGNINGVVETEVGYANGITKDPTYEQVCRGNTGFAETVKVIYKPQKVSLPFLLSLYYEVIDPTTINRQGGDFGPQYRTGIYYIDEKDKDIIDQSIKQLSLKYDEPIQIEVKVLENYYPAEENHQKYLDKNPGGYCHIGKREFENAKKAIDTSL